MNLEANAETAYRKNTLHVPKAALSAVKNILLFMIFPVIMLQIYGMLINNYSIPLSSNISSISTAVSYIGAAIAISAFVASLLGNERAAGLGMRLVTQLLVALYAVYIIGRTYAFVVGGQVSFAFSIFPIAAGFALIALLKFVPNVFDHFAKKEKSD